MAKKEKLKKQKKEKQKVVEANESKRTGLASEKSKKEKIEIEEISLEELTEKSEPQETEEDNFSEFMLSPAGEMPTPTLLSSTPFAPAPETANLEERGRDAPLREPTTNEQVREADYITVYNEPSYVAGTSEESILKGARERGMTGRTVEELRNTQQRILIEDWKEGGESIVRHGRDDLREYIVTETEIRQEENKLPFERASEYRPLKRKRG